MNHHIIQNLRRHQDQSPVKVQISGRTAASPPGFLLSDRDSAIVYSHPCRKICRSFREYFKGFLNTVSSFFICDHMTSLPVIFNEIREHADAVLCTWWLGSEAGNAICNVLWGEYNPSAKLPMTFPAHVGQIPIYYQNKSTGRPTALKQTYKASYIDASTEPAYPFGYGLSYTDFGYSDLKLLPGKAAGVHTEVSVKVTNTGKCAGEEVVQLYVQDKVASVTRPIKELKGFRKIHLNVGESKTVAFQITDDALGFYDNEMNYMVEPGDFVFMVGGSSDDVQQITYNLKE